MYSDLDDYRTRGHPQLRRHAQDGLLPGFGLTMNQVDQCVAARVNQDGTQQANTQFRIASNCCRNISRDGHGSYPNVSCTFERSADIFDTSGRATHVRRLCSTLRDYTCAHDTSRCVSGEDGHVKIFNLPHCTPLMLSSGLAVPDHLQHTLPHHVDFVCH